MLSGNLTAPLRKMGYSAEAVKAGGKDLAALLPGADVARPAADDSNAPAAAEKTETPAGNATTEPAQESPAQREHRLEGPQARHLLLLPANLGSLARITNDNGRFSATAGVRIVSTVRGYRAEVTDGRRLVQVKGEMGDAGEYLTPPALQAAPNSGVEAIIPARLGPLRFAPSPRRSATSMSWETSPRC